MYKLVMFDLDDTLAVSKSPLDPEMADLLRQLLEITNVAIISGGFFPQFKIQVIDRLSCSNDLLERLVILPTQGAAMYRYQSNEWKSIYSNYLSEDQKKKIFDAFATTFSETDFIQPEKIYGVQIEDRENQASFSALGSIAPVDQKKTWDPDKAKRLKLAEVLKRLLPEFAVGIGGMTSIDVTQKGIDKAFGVRKCMDILKLESKEILFIGDALFPGGNDAPVKETGIDWREIKSLEDTKTLIHSLIASNT